MAGLGTAGALVLGAAILFTLASAVVAFNGWPTLGGGGAAATQLSIAQPVAGSHSRHRPTAVPASAVTIVAQVPRASGRVPDAGGRPATSRVAASHPVNQGATVRLSAPVTRSGSIATGPVTQPAPAPTHVGPAAPVAPKPAPATPASGTASTVVGTVTATAAPVASTVTATAASAGSKTSTTVSNASGTTVGTVSKVVGSIGKPAVNVATNVSNTAAGVAATTTSVANTASTVVSSAGSTTNSTARSTTEGANAIVGGLQTTLHQVLSGL
jgi:ribonuclease E